MKIVISCSGKKNGTNLKYMDNEISFISNPSPLLGSGISHYFRPDDIIPDEKRTWRDYIITQTDRGLLKAYELYKNPIYKALHDKFKTDLYILSAGWGLVNSEFYIPKYDITFSTRGDILSRRTAEDIFNDFNHLKGIDESEKIIFFGGSDYINFFYELTKSLPNRKIIFYKKKDIPQKYPFLKQDLLVKLLKFESRANTNWHYGCAKKFLNNELEL